MAQVGTQTPNELMVVFSNTVSAGFDALSGPVNGVFGLMIILVVALTGVQWALSSNREILAAGFGKVLLIGVFAWLINDWQALSETLYSGFLELGLAAGGGELSREDFLNPGAVLHQGWRIVKALGDTPAPVENPLDVVGNLADALILGLAMIGILLAFAILALQIIISLLEFKIVTLGGFILLPFGIWSKSAFLAERPLGYVVSAGLKALALAIVVSGAQTIFAQLQPTANPDVYEALTILVAALLLAMLAIFIPNLASALVTGGPALGAGGALTGALAVGGLGGLATAGAMGAGVLAAGGAARLAGPARAAAGAFGGRSPSGPPAPTGPGSSPGPGGAPAAPSNDNTAARAPRERIGGAASGMAEPSPAWGGGAAASDHAAPTRLEAAGGLDDAAGGANKEPPAATVAAEADAARADFRRALDAPGRPSARPRPTGRAAALQAFFVANAGRGLMPAGESSGVISPNLRTEET
ncbi:type IV secretion system protein [Brevundimonas phoenicis]|uniref:type IV secretion system protein n=1 Tax=unclassified Brevundimonas TaxID=2622653 RepID=UPI0039B039C1